MAWAVSQMLILPLTLTHWIGWVTAILDLRSTIPGHGTIAGDSLSWTRGRVNAAIADKPQP